jgi:hypothetical protein
MRKPFSFLPSPLISKFPELCLFGHSHCHYFRSQGMTFLTDCIACVPSSVCLCLPLLLHCCVAGCCSLLALSVFAAAALQVAARCLPAVRLSCSSAALLRCVIMRRSSERGILLACEPAVCAAVLLLSVSVASTAVFSLHANLLLALLCRC